MESVGARKRRRTEAGLAYDNSLKRSRSLSELPDRSTLLKIENTRVGQLISKKNSKGDVAAGEEVVEVVGVDGQLISKKNSKGDDAAGEEVVEVVGVVGQLISKEDGAAGEEDVEVVGVK